MDLARNGEPDDPVPERRTAMNPSIPSRSTSGESGPERARQLRPRRGERRARIGREGPGRQGEDP